MKFPTHLRSAIPSGRIFAIAIIAIATCANIATAVDRSWNSSSSGDWSKASDWSPNGPPVFGDVVRIGNFFVAQNDTVTLDQNSSVAEVHITDGMNLDTDGFSLFERRFFPHVARACAGRLFDSLETVVSLMRRASTAAGLTTTVNVIRRAYETVRNATEEMKQNLKIVFDELLPKWNYRAIPQI